MLSSTGLIDELEQCRYFDTLLPMLILRLAATITALSLAAPFVAPEQTPQDIDLSHEPSLIVLDSIAEGFQPPAIISRTTADFSHCHDTKPQRIVVVLLVDESGSPKHVDLPGSESKKCADKAAIAAVQQFRFTPAQKDGRPILSNISVKLDTQPPLPDVSYPPILMKSVDPQMPADLLRSGGHVVVGVTFHIGPDGIPNHVRITSTGGPYANQSAINAVSQYRFWPAVKNGQPVAVDLTITVAFTR